MTAFKTVHPICTFDFFVLVFALGLLSSNPIVLSLLLISGFISDFSLRKGNAVKTFFIFLLPLIVFCGAFNSLFSHYGVTVLFTLPSGNSFTLESIVFGIVSGLKIAIMIVWLNSFNEVITPEKFIYLFGRFSPKIALVLSMALRFIPLLREQSHEIQQAQKGLGKSNGKIRSAIHNVSILITWTLERGIDTANSMSARGYGFGKRRAYSHYKFNPVDAAFLLETVAVTSVMIVFSGSISCTYNPVISLSSDLFSNLFCGTVMLIFAFSPLVYNISENKKWKFLKQKV